MWKSEPPVQWLAAFSSKLEDYFLRQSEIYDLKPEKPHTGEKHNGNKQKYAYQGFLLQILIELFII